MMTAIGKAETTHQELRQFGIGLGLLFGLVGGLLIWRGNGFGTLVILAGLFLALAFWFTWPGVRPFYAVWMKMARVMSRGITTILLILLFVLVLTPIAFLARVCGQRFVDRGFRDNSESYWKPHIGSNDRHSSEKQS